MDSDSRTTSQRYWKKKVLIGLPAAVAVWVVGDFIYWRVMDFRISRWEAKIERDADGVIVGCGAYSCGESQTAVLFLHGSNDTPYVYRKMVPEFVAAGYRCRVKGLPGFGKTTKRYAAIWTHYRAVWIRYRAIWTHYRVIRKRRLAIAKRPMVIGTRPIAITMRIRSKIACTN